MNETATQKKLNYSRPKEDSAPAAKPRKSRGFWPGGQGAYQYRLSQRALRRWLPFMAYLALWAMAYIANQHASNRTARSIDQVRKEIKDLRADYLYIKKDLMYRTKKSQISKQVAPMGLEELNRPPQKIRVDKDEY